MNFKERIYIIKQYINNNIDINKYINITKECKDDDLLMGKLCILDISLLEYIFILMYYDHNFIVNIDDNNDFYYKLKYSLNFLIFRINNENNEKEKIDYKLLIVLDNILQCYENIKNDVNNNLKLQTSSQFLFL